MVIGKNGNWKILETIVNIQKKIVKIYYDIIDIW